MNLHHLLGDVLIAAQQNSIFIVCSKHQNFMTVSSLCQLFSENRFINGTLS